MSKYMAGIVLYNAELDRLQLEINSVLPQVDLICLCDNGSQNIEEVESLISGINKIILLRNKINLGIGAASNQICRYAEKEGIDWVLMLDHDTICPKNLICTYKKYINDQSIGMICPNVVDKEIVNNVYCKKNKQKVEYVNRCIQSATFIKIDVWRKCQGFNEWMFIDFVDFDFCKRVELSGFKILRCNTVTVDHQLGKRVRTKHALFYEKLYKTTEMRIFKYMTYKNEFSAARVYYCTRNNIAFIKIFGNDLDKKTEWIAFFDRIIRRIVRSNHRFMIIKETIKGIVDGVRCNCPKYKIS